MADTDALEGSGRMWSPHLLLELARIWKRTELMHPSLGRVAKAQHVYDAFSARVHARGEHGGAKRSHKAVEDKVYAMKQMYRFITEMNRNAQRNAASSSSSSAHTQSWFALTPEQQRSLRSQHGVHIPSIPEEVFLVLDSVLQRDARRSATPRQPSSAPAASTEHVATQSASPPSLRPAAAVASSPGSSTVDSHFATSAESRRNWSADATAELARAWSDIQRAHPQLRGAPLSEQVHRALEARTDGLLARSHKAVAEKMQSMKAMVQCIQSYDASVLAAAGSSAESGKRTWFELTNAERRQLRKTHKIRAANLSREQFEQMRAIVSARAGVETPAGEAAGEAPGPLEPVGRTEQRQATESLAVSSTLDMRGTLQHIAAQVLQTTASESQACCHCDVSPVRAPSPSSSGRGRARKRVRVDASPTALRAQGAADAVSAPSLLDEIRALHEEDRAERQRQHAELLGALRELMALVRSSLR